MALEGEKGRRGEGEKGRGFYDFWSGSEIYNLNAQQLSSHHPKWLVKFSVIL
jgi:hypothetical protein